MEALMENTVAIVDDDRNTLSSIAAALEAEGFGVRTYTDGSEALQDLVAKPADIAILENKMPGMNGMELLGRLREDSAIPIMFLTSNADEVDQLMGLRMGADAYLTKPVSMRLLIERIRVLLRHAAFEKINSTSDEFAFLRGDLRLNPTRHQCTWQGTDVRLTVTEFHLLRSLAYRPGHVKTRAQLREAANGHQASVDFRSIDSHVKRLRLKLKMADPRFAQIQTVYRLGYRFV
jgi:two-component system response regulator ChvI